MLVLISTFSTFHGLAIFAEFDPKRHTLDINYFLFLDIIIVRLGLIVDFVIQVNGRLELEDGLRTGVLPRGYWPLH